MAIFNSYVKLPEGNPISAAWSTWHWRYEIARLQRLKHDPCWMHKRNSPFINQESKYTTYNNPEKEKKDKYNLAILQPNSTTVYPFW